MRMRFRNPRCCFQKSLIKRFTFSLIFIQETLHTKVYYMKANIFYTKYDLIRVRYCGDVLYISLGTFFLVNTPLVVINETFGASFVATNVRTFVGMGPKIKENSVIAFIKVFKNFTCNVFLNFD